MIFTFEGKRYRLWPLCQRAAKLGRKKNRTAAEQREFVALSFLSEHLQAYNEAWADIFVTIHLKDPSLVAQAHGLKSALQLGLVDQPATAEFLSTRKSFLDMTTWIEADMWNDFYKPKRPEEEEMGNSDHRVYKELAPIRARSEENICRSFLSRGKPNSCRRI